MKTFELDSMVSSVSPFPNIEYSLLVSTGVRFLLFLYVTKSIIFGAEFKIVSDQVV
ncbi:hypothetical protein LEP1GSC020_3805 [Leptospira interrogans serovar Grippotyphosa str. 2006006986]|nr:hypothetical protein LEP1GSC020_3805 [Leptospira interrogans serovar Grippotyphosa str. 2006006986]EMN67909.1 hypothetical protein LEP1GSC098_4111 [Leptospira interrogans serovar Grippotyphosa str. UI 08434]